MADLDADFFDFAAPASSSDDDDASGDPADARCAASRYSSGRAVARAVAETRAPLGVDFGACASALVSAPTISERANCARAVGALAQAQAHTDAMREAGVVDAVVALLRAEGDGEAAVAAADALRHLACANDRNRDRARELGAIPLLVAQLRRVAGVAHADMGEADVAAVTAATAALRNLSYQNAQNRDAIRAAGGLAPLLDLVATGDPPAPPPGGSRGREAAYRAAAALENLASDHAENEATIVERGVVPAMKELLLGKVVEAVSQKAAKKGREEMLRLITLDERRRKAREHAAAAEAAVSAASAAAAAARAKAVTLAAIEARGAGGESVAAAARAAALEASTALGGAQSELAALTSMEWASAVARYACVGGAAPPPFPTDEKEVRRAVFGVLQRPPLGDALACETAPVDGGGLGCVVRRRAEPT